MKVISRQRAKNRGLIHYFTGEPCLRGHIAPRTVSSCTCTACKSENWQEEKRRNHEINTRSKKQGVSSKVLSQMPMSEKTPVEMAKALLTKRWGNA